MVKQADFPVTNAIRFLKSKGISFEQYLYKYLDKGGTSQSAKELDIDEHNVIKTLVMEADGGKPFIVLMHGDMEVSQKELARQINAKQIIASEEGKAMKFTGYKFGGTSPFGLLREMPIYAERSIFELDYVFINGGKQGFLVKIHPNDIKRILNVIELNVAIK